MALTNKDIWDRQGVDVSTDSYTHSIVQHRFMASQTGEAITAERTILLKDVTHLNVADSITQLMAGQSGVKPPITGETDKHYVITGTVTSHEALVFITQGSHSRNSRGPVYDSDDDEDHNIGIKVSRIKIEITGHREAIKLIFSHLNKTFSDVKVSAVKWWYKADHGPSSQEIFLEPITTLLRPEFYPYMKETPDQYLQRYLNSDEPVLLVAGPPGTGKTTFLRHLLCNHNLSAEIIYDETLMTNDSIFQSFLFGTSDVMLIEDADRILTPREGGDNSLMARFLNVSEGVIILPNKKMIFTTNISDYSRVDQALIRAGRCFDVLITRELTYQEAQIAATVAGLQVPSDNKDYTLAELFHRNSGGKISKMGF